MKPLNKIKEAIVTKSNTLTIDPPNGHSYGFPKEMPANVKDVTGWLLENGYPQWEVDKFTDGVPYRVIGK